MPALLIGALALVLFLLLARGYSRANPHALAQGVRAGIILVSIVGGIGALATGKPWLIFLPLGVLAAMFAQESWRRQRGGSETGGTSSGSGYGTPRARSGGMSRAEALSVLGLKEGATEDQILEAYRRLIMQNHPDRGGSTYLAAKINLAKDVLLGR